MTILHGYPATEPDRAQGQSSCRAEAQTTVVWWYPAFLWRVRHTMMLPHPDDQDYATCYCLERHVSSSTTAFHQVLAHRTALFVLKEGTIMEQPFEHDVTEDLADDSPRSSAEETFGDHGDMGTEGLAGEDDFGDAMEGFDDSVETEFFCRRWL